MRTLQVLLSILLLGSGLGGCIASSLQVRPATEVEYVHTPFQPPAIADRTVVEMPFELAWNTLVRNLAVNYFAVNQIDKESRFISINASQDAGGIGRDQDWWLAYASCGTSMRRFNFNDKEYAYEYATLGSRPYSTVFAADGVSFWDEVVPTVTAEIRMNIYLSPLDATHTEMSVNARYRITRYLHGKRYSLRRNNQYLYTSDIVDPSGSTITFTSQSPGQYPSTQTHSIACYSTGQFESAVIGLLQTAR